MHNLKNNDKDILVTRYMANLNIKLNSLIPSHFKLDKKIKKKKIWTWCKDCISLNFKPVYMASAGWHQEEK